MDQTKTPSVEEIIKRKFGHIQTRIEEYERIDLLGEGTYGEVSKSKHSKSGDILAVKKIKMDKEKEGFPITALREISVLKSLNHKNIVKLKDVITKLDQPRFYMIFEYVAHDLAGLIDHRVSFAESDIKSIMKQICEGVLFLHKQGIMHRDLKASNILMTKEGVIKIADFGLGRRIAKGGLYTNKVVTRWYRSPELLLGVNDYNACIDVWSVGCILGELLMQKAIFPGEDDLHQVELIFSLCGTPTVRTWPGIEKLERFNTLQFKQTYSRQVVEKFRKAPNATPMAVDLLDKLLEVCPTARITLEDALKHEWFQKKPFPTIPANLPISACNELAAKKRRKLEREQGVRGTISPPNKKVKYEEKNDRESHYNSTSTIKQEERRSLPQAPPRDRGYDNRPRDDFRRDDRHYDERRKSGLDEHRRDSSRDDRQRHYDDRRDSRGYDDRSRYRDAPRDDKKHDDDKGNMQPKV